MDINPPPVQVPKDYVVRSLLQSMGLSAATLTWIHSRVTEAVGDRFVKVILFGSQVSGDAGPESDIDLLVVVKGDNLLRHLSVTIRRALLDLTRPVDVIVIDAKDFEATRDVIGAIAYPASHHGLEIHA